MSRTITLDGWASFSLTKFPLRKKVVGGIVLLAIVIVGIVLGYFLKTNNQGGPVKHSGSAVSNGKECAAITRTIFEIGGSAADAAIALLFCEGVAVPQSCGLGGGFFLTIYTKATGKVETLNARETAPQAATQNMFVGEEHVTGIRSVAVPGDLKGLWELHRRYGTLPWRKLIQPTINLCRNGHYVSKYFADVLHRSDELIRNSTGLAEVFVNPATNAIWKAGDRIKRLKLAETLEIIAEDGADTLYNNGTIAKLLLNEMQEMGGIITTEDLMNYTVRWEDSISSTFMNDTIHSVPLPASGSVLIFILNILNGFLPSTKDVTFYQRFVESLKFAYAKRTELADYRYAPGAYEVFQNMLSVDVAQQIRSKIEDNRTYPDYKHYGAKFSVPDDHGTIQVSVIAPNGDAVSVTSSINSILGSKIRSRSTGLILNDSMDDFSTPGVTNAYGVQASPSNFIAPGKQPLSSMCPAIVLDGNGDVKLVIGGAGGSRITSAVAYAIVSQIMFDEPLGKTIQDKRFHHQLLPMHILYEEGFDETILSKLKERGHVIVQDTAVRGFVAVTGIARRGNKLTPVFDSRRQGSTFVF